MLMLYLIFDITPHCDTFSIVTKYVPDENGRERRGKKGSDNR